MEKAIEQAQKAAEKKEVPIGCVIVHGGGIIGAGYNLRNTKGNALAHAEIIAINEACEHLGDWRLENCTIYVTVEPCPMCAGAILQARIPRLVYGAASPKAGAAGSLINLLQDKRYNHVVDITKGVLEQSCSKILTDFFATIR
ncbi:MAG: tRNA adenosine(34) deaminase TadA [Defluviitaleaceae bacterium]|nr:tRNA adenosine(34) deaminase TadA [Defluviitaleaceae bacterium]